MPEALERLVECDLALGLTDEAKANAAVLGHNYPGSDWYVDAYALVTERHPRNPVQRLVRPQLRRCILTSLRTAGRPRQHEKLLISACGRSDVCQRAEVQRAHRVSGIASEV